MAIRGEMDPKVLLLVSDVPQVGEIAHCRKERCLKSKHPLEHFRRL